jgi:RHS repeat-associated protein
MAEPNGLYYMRARYYDPSVGRFVSEDPLGFGGGDVNLYAYVKNRLIIAKDPTGTTIWICSRPAFYSRDPGTGGPNHAFLYDDRDGDDCGMGNPVAHENVKSPTVGCTPVPGTQGADISNKVMSCCHQKAASEDWSMYTWRPGTHDCHNMVGDCLTENGLQNPGAPGGRTGCNTCDDQ